MINSDVIWSPIHFGSLDLSVCSEDVCELKGKIVFTALTLTTAVNADAGSNRWRGDWQSREDHPLRASEIKIHAQDLQCLIREDLEDIQSFLGEYSSLFRCDIFFILSFPSFPGGPQLKAGFAD